MARITLDERGNLVVDGDENEIAKTFAILQRLMKSGKRIKASESGLEPMESLSAAAVSTLNAQLGEVPNLATDDAEENARRAALVLVGLGLAVSSQKVPNQRIFKAFGTTKTHVKVFAQVAGKREKLLYNPNPKSLALKTKGRHQFVSLKKELAKQGVDIETFKS